MTPTKAPFVTTCFTYTKNSEEQRRCVRGNDSCSLRHQNFHFFTSDHTMTSLTEAERRVQERLESSWGRCITTSNEKLASSKSELHRLIHKLDNADSDTTTVSCGWKDIVDRCRSHPKEVSMVDGRGRTCLSLACARNPPLAVVETMLAASPTSRWRFRPHHELRDKTGWTAMTIAITNNASLEVIRLLATQQDLVNTPDHYGNTPLHLACQYKVMVEILLKAGGDAGRENNNGKTPLHVAIENKASLKVVRMLSEGIYLIELLASLLASLQLDSPRQTLVTCNTIYSLS